MKTTLEEERAEQRRWKARPDAAGAAEFFNRLVENEFAPPEVIERWTRAALEQVVRFAAARVPYYQRLFEARRVRLDTVGTEFGLSRLPLLTRSDVLEAGEELCARELPAGEQAHGWSYSSGTTGRPVRVLQTATANLMFSCLTQRHYRWFRFDPARTFATIRLARHMPQDAAGNPLRDGAMLRQERWRYAGAFFATGPHVYFNVTNPVERQLAWLASQRPDYLQSYSESLEHLVLACDGAWPAPGIRKSVAISEQVTPSMRRLIESVTGVPLEQGYGLNEVGLVAARCSGGRYHVHIEHCVVEIVDDGGAPCPPGRSGRLVVTTLRNPAMPLLRYETGDLAEVVAGPCPCGRMLPAFGEIVGRYSRIAYLPEGTLAKVGALRGALEAMPAAALRNLRQFQVHQFRDGRFELRVVAAGPLPGGFAAAMRAAWTVAAGAGAALDIALVDAIPRSPGGKFQDFTSDFMPAPDAARN